MVAVRDKAVTFDTRFILILLLLLSGIAAALLIYFPPVPTTAQLEKTSGMIKFFDASGNPLTGAVQISAEGAPGELKSNIKSIVWANFSGARVYYNAMDTKNISINLRISGDSPDGRVILENYGIVLPESVNTSPPGIPVKYLQISTAGVYYADGEITLRYTDAEMKGLDENQLALYRYDSANSTWRELPTSIDAVNNTLSAQVNSFSFFAITGETAGKNPKVEPATAPGKIEVRDAGKKPVISSIKTYDEAGKPGKIQETSTFLPMDIPAGGEIEVDALKTKNVAVKLKVNTANSGEIILDDFGKNNPESAQPPGRAVKFVEISAVNISYSFAEIAIKYSDAEIGGVDENLLAIYHCKNGEWIPEATTVDAANNTLTATVTSLSNFSVIENTTSYNATLYIYYTKNNADPADDELVKTLSLTNLKPNGTTYDLGNASYLYANNTYVVELQIRVNNTYEFDADYIRETFFKAGVPFGTSNVSGRQYLVNTTLVTNDGNVTHDIFVNTTHQTNYSIDANAQEVGRIGGDLDIIAIENVANGGTYWFENGNSWNKVAIEDADLNSTNPYALAVGDLDKDGDIDVAVGNTANSIWIYENDGSPQGANWNARYIGTVPFGDVLTLVMADLEGDGYLDIISGDVAQDVRIFRNDGTPFNDAWSTTNTIETDIGNQVYKVAAGDIDGDGDLDIVAGGGANLYWYENDGTPFSGAWTRHTIATLGSGYVYSVALGDLDNDGRLDVVMGTGSTSQTIVVYRNNGTPTYLGSTSYTVESDANGSVWDVGVADLNGDSYIDIVADAFSGARDVLWYKNDGTPFDAGWTKYKIDDDTNATNPYGIAIGDIDSNGYPDVVVGVADSNVYWYENNGTPSSNWNVTTVTSPALGGTVRRVAVADLDGDANSYILDYCVNSTESAEKGVDSAEFSGWNTLSANTNYSFYFVVTPDSEWNNSSDNVTFFCGNEAGNWSSLTEPKIFGAVRTPIKVKWSWTVLSAAFTGLNYSVNITPSAYEQDVVYGNSTEYTLTITNNGNADETYTVSIFSETGDTVNFTLPSTLTRTSVFVPGFGGNNTTVLNVTTKDISTAIGSKLNTTVKVTSNSDSSYTDSAMVTTTISWPPVPEVSVTVSPSSQSVAAGSQVNYTVAVRNAGNYKENFTISLDHASAGYLAYALGSTYTGTINAGAIYTTNLTVNASSGAPSCFSDAQIVTASTTGYGGASASSTATTTVSGVFCNFSIIENITSYNATLYIYYTRNNADPADDEPVKIRGLTDLKPNGTTYDLGNAKLYANNTFVVELQIRVNNTYDFDADYLKETFFRAGVPFGASNVSGRQYLINTTLVTNDGNKTHDIFVNTTHQTNYSIDANAQEVGVIRGDLDIIAIEDVAGGGTYWFENGNSWNKVAIEDADLNSTNPYALAVGDLDNDGDIDIAVGNTANSIWIYENDGSPQGANWNARYIGTVPDGDVNTLAMADLDGDGYLDIISGDVAQDVRIFRNDGTPFNDAWSTTNNVETGIVGQVRKVAAGDIDGDGDLDIVAGGNGNLYWYENDGTPFSGAWTRHTIASGISQVYSVALGDLDNDGWLDVVMGNDNGFDGQDIIVYRNNGTPTYLGSTSYTVESDAGGLVFDVDVADINGDGYIDIVADAWVGAISPVMWYKNDGTPFDAGWTKYTIDGSTNGQNPYGIAIGDIDSNGYPDVVVGVADSNVYWYENNGTPSSNWNVTTVTSPALGGTVRRVMVADLDGDANSYILDYHVNSTESVEKGVDDGEFSGWNTLSANTNYSFYFIITPDTEWSNSSDSVTFFCGNEAGNWSSLTEPKIYGAIRTPIKVKWTWSVLSGPPALNYSVNITPSAYEQDVVYGNSTEYTMTITNNGNEEETYTVSIFSETGDTANFTLPSTLTRTSVYVPAGGTNTTVLNVTTKDISTAVGSKLNTTVKVSSILNSSYNASTTVMTTITWPPAPDVSVTITPPSQSVAAGSQVNYSVAVRNAGNYKENFTISLDHASAGYLAYTLGSTYTGPINAGAIYTTNLTVNASSEAPVGDSDTQIVTASTTGYGGASASGTATTTVSAPDKIFLATNRFVILDDDFTGTPESGFVNPYRGSGIGQPGGGGNDAAKGKATTMGAYVLYLDSSGTPVSGKNVTFTFYKPGSYGVYQTIYNTTNSIGVASAFSNINGSYYYGRWNVKAENGSISDTTSFIYNWWGCNYNSAGDCSRNHQNHNWASGATVNSPYMDGYDRVVDDDGEHQRAGICTGCHRSYDSTNGSAVDAYPSTASTIQSGVHQGIRCDNSSCHGSITDHQTNMDIHSCYGGTGCHPFRNDISNKSTLNGVVSNYSNSTGTYDKYHNQPNYTIQCIICHGPMHNITKPDESQRLINNSDTESSHCRVCHLSYGKHNATVNCTLCHSEDVHLIQVFAQNATYVNLTKSNPNSARGNCTTCHQNSTFVNTLKNQTKAGAFNDTTPQITNPMNHSDDSTAGKKWNSTPGYWTSGTNSSAQLTSCYYCHKKTLHNTTALGRPSQFDGNNAVNMTVSSAGNWCASCHYQGYVNGSDNYDKMVSTFTNASLLVPPEITGNATYAPTGVSGYLNHSGYALDDLSCKNCHYRGSTTITQVMHNATQGAAGPDCVACHDLGGSGAPSNKRINASAMKLGVHKNLNNGTSNSTVLTDLIDKACWACHGSGLEPGSSHPSNYAIPYNCTECHNSTGTLSYTNTSVKNNLTTKWVYEHAQSPYYEAISSTRKSSDANCTGCHDKSKVSFTDSGLSVSANVSHYASLTSLVRNTTSCSYCHKSSANATAYWANTIRHPARYVNDSFCDNCHNTSTSIDLHSRPLVKPFEIHMEFDWHNDDHIQGPDLNEGCTACHLFFPTVYSACEDCHLVNRRGPLISSLRSDINDTTPFVSAHTNFSSLNVPNQSGVYGGQTRSSCFAWNSATTAANCHGITVTNKSDGYWAHNGTGSNSAPWHATVTIDRLLNTTNCTYCHVQTNVTIRAAWANPTQVVNGSHYWYTGSNNSECYFCHVYSGTMPKDFHQSDVIKESCAECHFNYTLMSSRGNLSAYVNGSMYNSSVHYSVQCQNCHTGGHVNVSARKACECCHTVQSDPKNQTDRHNVTHQPSTYRFNINGTPTSVVNITDCNYCHNSTILTNARNTWGNNCDSCHTNPDSYYYLIAPLVRWLSYAW